MSYITPSMLGRLGSPCLGFGGLPHGTVLSRHVEEEEVSNMALCLSSHGQIKYMNIVLCFHDDIYAKFFFLLVFLFWPGCKDGMDSGGE